VPTETRNGFVICSRPKPRIVDGRQQLLSASDNAEAPGAGSTSLPPASLPRTQILRFAIRRATNGKSPIAAYVIVHLLALAIGFGVIRVCARRVLVNRVCGYPPGTSALTLFSKVQPSLGRVVEEECLLRTRE
jgi:hypothetical protein